MSFSVVQSSWPTVWASTNMKSQSGSVSNEVQKSTVAPPAGTLIVCLSRLKETSAICEYAYALPVCGSKGPPGRSYLAATALVNCGYVDAGRIPLVEMNEFALFWFAALSAPLNENVIGASGDPTPSASNTSPSS